MRGTLCRCLQMLAVLAVRQAARHVSDRSGSVLDSEIPAPPPPPSATPEAKSLEKTPQTAHSATACQQHSLQGLTGFNLASD